MINDGLCHYEENLWNEEDDEKSWVSFEASEIFRAKMLPSMFLSRFEICAVAVSAFTTRCKVTQFGM